MYVPPSSYDSLSYEPKHELHPILQIQFGILAPEEIRLRSVVEVTLSETYSNGQPVPQGLFDQRMGSLDISTLCGTCNQLSTLCQGHSGHIELAKPVFNLKHLDVVKKVLKAVCYNCSALLANVELPDVRRAIYDRSSARRLDAAVTKANTNKGVCLCCKRKQPEKYVKPPDDSWVLSAVIPLDAGDAEAAASAAASAAGGSATGGAGAGAGADVGAVLEAPTSVVRVFEAEDVQRILARITDVDCEALGFNVKACRPEWLIQTVQLVPSPIMRPSTQNDTKQRSDDDLTSILGEIVKHNNALRAAMASGSERQVRDAHRLVQMYTSSFIDNQPGSGKLTVLSHTKRPLAGVCPRLRKKEGRMRNNLMGKRCDQTARAVITPDPLIGIDELGVPERIAMNQTFGEVVNEYNIAFLAELVARGPDKYPGATSVKRHRDGFTDMTALRFGGQNTAIDLQPGDVVYRHLIDGDVILFNRQPSLHKMSMMAHRVRVMPHLTFRLNVCATTPYNADFDGDEMNTHNAQCVQTRSELNDLSAVKWLMINPKDCKPSIAPVQDCLLGLYRMTLGDVDISRRTFMNLMMKASRFGGRLPKPGGSGGAFTGRQATSVCLSPETHLEVPNDVFAAGKDGPDSPHIVSIRNGVHERGALTKRVFANASRSLMHAAWADEGPNAAVRLINDVQRLSNAWLRVNGFSVGVSDLVPSDDVARTVDANIAEMNREIDAKIAALHVNGLDNNSTLANGDFFETQLMNIAQGHDNATKKALSAELGDANRMMAPIRCKSKGDALNIQQMMTCVGQQHVDGRRIQADRNGRTMAHFACFDRSAAARGYVERSFIRGLTPTENFFHAIAGREGLIDTAVKSVTGDTPVVIVEGGVTKTVAIGDWIDARLAAALPGEVEHHELRRMELLHMPTGEVFIPTTDERGVVTWGDVTAITRHDPGTELYRITTAGGRSVVVTESKSLLVWNAALGVFREELTPAIKVGDRVPVTVKLGALPPGAVIHPFPDSFEDGLADGTKVAMAGLVPPSSAITAPEAYVKGFVTGFAPAITSGVFPDGGRRRFDSIQICDSGRHAEALAMLFSRLGTRVEIDGNLVAFYVVSNDVTLNDVFMDRIVSIDVIDLTTPEGKANPNASPKVYDLTVPSTLNFGLANGLQVRDTSETGYTQRQLVKALEDAKVMHDLTVRGSSRSIVQFLAGDDGMDPSYVEVQAVPQMLAPSVAELMARHLLTEADVKELRAVVAPEALKRQPPGWLERCAARFDALRADRAFVAMRVMRGRREDAVRYPIPFDRILRRAEERARAAEERAAGAGKKRTQTDLTPWAVLEVGDRLAAELVVQRRCPGNKLLGVLLRGYLCPKQLVLRRRLRAEHLVWVEAEVRRRFLDAFASPGDMVGIVAAQSIGETITQLTLNSFHTSGTQTAVKATSGVPRLKELLSCSRNPKTPFLTVRLQPDVAADQGKALRVQQTLETTRVRDLLRSSAIYFDPPGADAEGRQATLLEADRALVARYERTADLGGPGCPSGALNPWLVRLEFDREKLYLHGVTMLDVALRVQDKLRVDGEPGARCVFADDVDDALIMRVHANTDADAMHARDDPVAAIKALEDGLVNTAVKGVPGVEKTAISKVPFTRFDEATSAWVSGEEWVIDTAGTNLRDALAMPGVDPRRTVSSDVLEVCAVLGIEAARQALYNELSEVLKENPIAHRHLSLLVDMMTCRGTLMAINRHGINRSDSGPLAHASFEEVDAVLFKAALWGKVDAMAGISANIMVGQMAPCGTADSAVVLDEERLAELWPAGATVNASFDRAPASAPSLPRRAARGAGYRLLNLPPPVGPHPARAPRATTYDLPRLVVVGAAANAGKKEKEKEATASKRGSR